MKRARLLLVLMLAGACEGATPGAPARLWTTFDLRDAAARGETVLGGALSLVPGGMPATHFVPSPPEVRLPVRFAFGEGERAAYVTTELWANFPVVWVQPMYVLVTGWDPQARAWRRLAHDGQPAPPVFSVGVRSPFYSPFWQVFYVEVPPETPADRYRSVKRILDDRLPMHTGPGRLAALVPPGTAIEPATAPAAALLGEEIGIPAAGRGWVDGEEVAVLDFGVDRFTWNERLEVDEAPLFMFFARTDAGGWQFTGLPNVGGTGPLFSGRRALGPADRPAFGSLWRLWAVLLPPTAGVVLPAGAPAGDLEKLAIRIHRVDPVDGRPPPVAFRVTARAACFDDGDLDDCVWLDAQGRIEDQLPAALVRSEALVTCPWVSYAGGRVR